ncbi:MAG: YhgE/Pip domain-containing protein [Lachnospiraceae bacterium]|nr:YhgE/Pip domain-containing protein [Lachnospiraceae bacterium]
MADNNKKYEEFYKNYLDEQHNTHQKNQQKIRVGLKVNIFLPLIFLLISFLTQGSKLIFLILWIVSLFGIAFYLMYVEYTDHLMQKRLQEIETADASEQALIGEALAEAGDRAGARITERAENVEARMRERLPEKIESLKAPKKVAYDIKQFQTGVANIFRVFWSDAKRLSTNVVAMVVIIGLSVIPCLYAWFNILSNWAPYETEATGNLQVAIASIDRGTAIEGKELNVGDKIIENLKGNNSINWIFVDTAEEAVSGVNAGDYYAALVVSETFSEDLVSFIGGNVTHPSIVYYENEKKNAIAPKITGKVKTAIQKEVNKAFVSTLAGSVLEASRYITADGSDSLTDTAMVKLQTLDRDLTTVITILDSYISILDTTDNLMSAADQVSQEMDLLLSSAGTVVDNANSTVNATKTTIDTTSDLITMKMHDLDTALVLLDQVAQGYVNDADKKATETLAALNAVPTIGEDKADEIVNSIKTTINDSNLTDEEKTKALEALDSTKLKDALSTLNTDIQTIQTAAKDTTVDATELYNKLSTDATTCRNELNALSDSYQNTLKPQIRDSISSVENSITEVKSLLNYSTESVSDITAILKTYPDMMGVGREHLEKSREQVATMQSKLRGLIKDMEGLNENERYALVMKLLQTDPELISGFISEPIELEEKPLYSIDTNGSATAPFYIVLSIWVGALILVAIMKTDVKKCTIPDIKPRQQFFGRYITFFLIGQLQTVITVLGALFYVRIQCHHPFLFWLAMAFTSLTYTFFLYALTYAFGAVGEAVAVVLMVLQVAGSGGTFPIQVLPTVYQVLYKYMPFAYSMGAARECIAGMYGNNYAHDIGALCCYIIASLVIGLLISKGSKNLIHIIEKSKEGSDLMV